MSDHLQRRLAEIGAPADVRALAAALAEQAVRDSLTGLYNRRFFDEALAQNIETARRYSRELSLVLFDLNRLKQINDIRGHQAGDEALKVVAKMLQKTVRKADIVCRIGGDEFAAILPETGLACTRNFIERFFQVLKENGRTEVSAGAAALPTDNLFAAADAELRIAKPAR